MKVKAFVNALPGFGKVKTEKLMEELGIPAERRLQGLGSNQMAALEGRWRRCSGLSLHRGWALCIFRGNPRRASVQNLAGSFVWTSNCNKTAQSESLKDSGA